MQDRPTTDELLGAIEAFLDSEVVPNLAGSRGFHSRVAANAIRIVRRELALSEEQMAAEWEGLNEGLGRRAKPATQKALAKAIRARNAELCERIRAGDAESTTDAGRLFEHVRQRVA